MLTRERLEELRDAPNKIELGVDCYDQREVAELARMALAWVDSEADAKLGEEVRDCVGELDEHGYFKKRFFDVDLSERIHAVLLAERDIGKTEVGHG